MHAKYYPINTILNDFHMCFFLFLNQSIPKSAKRYLFKFECLNLIINF